jgi:hypothetical protein
MNKKIIGTLCCIVCIILAIGICLNINRNKKYNYDSLQTFMNDIHNNDIGKNVTQNEPIFIAYEKDGFYCVELLSDITINQDYVFEKTKIDLQEHTVTLENNVPIKLFDSNIKNGTINILVQSELEDIITLSKSVVSGLHFNVICDGGKSHLVDVLDNAEIIGCRFSAYGDVNELRFIATEKESVTKVEGCSFVTDFKECNRIYAISAHGELSVLDSEFNLKSNSSVTDGKVYSGAVYQSYDTLEIDGCDIRVENYAKYGFSRGVIIGKDTVTVNISNSNIYADSHYLMLDGSYGSLSQGIASNGLDVNIKNCVVRGIHSAMQVGGGCYVEDSRFESTGHGGIYFGRNWQKDENGVDMPSTYIVKNSEICWCEPDGIFKEDVGKEDFCGDNRAAFYIGGSDYASNITVYMVGCKVYGNKYSGVLRGTSNERQNTLYISDTTMDKPMRIDKQTLEMYVGKGCNISMDSEIYWKKKLTKCSEAEGIEVFFDETVDYSKLF